MSRANPIYNEKDAAEYLGGSDTPLSTRTLQRWRLEGFGPPYVKLGRLVRYTKADLDAFVQARRFDSTSMQEVFGGSNDR